MVGMVRTVSTSVAVTTEHHVTRCQASVHVHQAGLGPGVTRDNVPGLSCMVLTVVSSADVILTIHKCKYIYRVSHKNSLKLLELVKS